VDPLSHTVVFGRDSGKGGLFSVIGGDLASIKVIPNPLQWPKEPAISPGGRFVTYIDFDPQSLLKGRTLHLTDTTTGNYRVLARGTKADRVGQVVFSPDGAYLLYEVIHMGKSFDVDEFRKVDLTTFQDTSLLTSADGSARSPTFSRDGATLFYWNQRCLMQLELKTMKKVTQACLPNGASMWPTHQGEPAALSSDRKRIVVTALIKGCPRLLIAEGDEKKFRLFEGDPCAYSPQFLDDQGDTVSYVHLPRDGARVLSTFEWKTGSIKRISPLEGIVYQPRIAKDGVYAVSATPRHTRKLHRFTQDGNPPVVIATGSGIQGEEKIVQEFRRMWIPAKDGSQIPVAIFKPECRSSKAAKPPVIFYLHGSPLGADDVPPRLMREIGYLVGKGMEVIAVNYRGSTGYGEDFKAAGSPELQAQDVIDTLDFFLPSLVGRDLYALGICFGGEHLLRRVIGERADRFKGVVVWSGNLLPQQWLTPRTPDTLWVITERDGILQREKEFLALHKGSVVHPKQRVVVDDTHLVLAGSSRLKALQAVERFVSEHSGARCN
jgi:dipeptidyl aminopeptidase/acylaminoacyl peptidase